MKSTDNVLMTSSNPRGGIDLHFDLQSRDLLTSASWQVAGRTLCFIYLPAGHSLNLDAGTHYIKVVTGRLSQPARGCFAAPFATRSTRVRDSEIVADVSGALFALLTETAETPTKIESLDQLVFSGPASDRLIWRSFAERFGEFMDHFDDADCHMMDGIHLLDGKGQEIAYVNFWACGKGVDLSTHNHAHEPSAAAPAFAETHWVIDAATETSGMYRTQSPGYPERTRQPLKRGEEHGPYFAIDPNSQLPVLLPNGAVKYGWHGWEGGADGKPEQAYDFVAAFEVNPALAKVGLESESAD